MNNIETRNLTQPDLNGAHPPLAREREWKAEKAAQKNVKLLFDAVKLLPQKAT